MPYISKEEVKEKRDLLRHEFPNFKISVTKRHSSTICVKIFEAPINLDVNHNGYEQVNQYYIKEHYAKYPEVAVILQKIYDIASKGKCVECEDKDYGSIPNFYVSINIGEWDKPFIERR